ncbi:hypothetical protein PENTCL1PPCAC_24375, partial [Pristionchus entomophagus]
SVSFRKSTAPEMFSDIFTTVVHNNFAGPINSFMSWHVWVPLGRLSFCGYLVHYPMIYIILAQSHDEVYFSSFTDFITTRFIPTVVMTYLVSIFWSACFEISIAKVLELLIGGRRGQLTPTVQRKQPKIEVEELDAPDC